MPSFIELLKDHALIPAVASGLSTLTHSPDPQPRAAVETLRRLARLLEAHWRAEAEFLDQDRDNGDHEFAALAATWDEHFRVLVAQWEAYALQWDEVAIERDWPAFRAASADMIARIHAQVAAENQSLYAAAQRYGLAPLLPGDARGEPC